MEDSSEYQIFIGCNDPHLGGELVKEHELREMVIRFFERNEIDFSMLTGQGGYVSENNYFVYENTICINIIGSADTDMIKLARSLSMFMGQEHVLVIKQPVQLSFN